MVCGGAIPLLGRVELAAMLLLIPVTFKLYLFYFMCYFTSNRIFSHLQLEGTYSCDYVFETTLSIPGLLKTEMPLSLPYFTTSAHSLHVGSGISRHAELQSRLCTFDLAWVGVELSRSRVYWCPPPAADQDRVHGLLLDADGGFV